ncbi:MAG: FYDLN acid domain-containing protein [Acidobacteriota bacterium]
MPDLGKKFECYNCGTKFYNLGRPEAVCPKCGANQKDAKSNDAPAPAPRPPRRVAVIMEPPPEGNPDEFGEAPEPVAEEEDRGEDEELDEDQIVEADHPPEEEDS